MRNFEILALGWYVDTLLSWNVTSYSLVAIYRRFEWTASFPWHNERAYYHVVRRHITELWVVTTLLPVVGGVRTRRLVSWQALRTHTTPRYADVSKLRTCRVPHSWHVVSSPLVTLPKLPLWESQIPNRMCVLWGWNFMFKCFPNLKEMTHHWLLMY
jgi:hypothetical protein